MMFLLEDVVLILICKNDRNLYSSMYYRASQFLGTNFRRSILYSNDQKSPDLLTDFSGGMIHRNNLYYRQEQNIRLLLELVRLELGVALEGVLRGVCAGIQLIKYLLIKLEVYLSYSYLFHKKLIGSTGMPLFRTSKCRCGPVTKGPAPLVPGVPPE